MSAESHGKKAKVDWKERSITSFLLLPLPDHWLPSCGRDDQKTWERYVLLRSSIDKRRSKYKIHFSKTESQSGSTRKNIDESIKDNF
jgi:hypothetical protein